ncbi:serine hydrolase domain-containing protein [Flagellimonas allohymeniacidonis]|uniref:Class A beta-lactamase-related serine hydrolase n=1 Tax=Flagellimonas allohymeniacidonis TaxID=2517819 RepID=A0A4V2HSB6_9FLAO|nr:serine hydrolase domain-containing protein [Allomuricauda hymeniacidonis]TAI47170.1 class A beta-lactamase-related serine hydrolase [Allomuricauda hymeniacidonis]
MYKSLAVSLILLFSFGCSNSHTKQPDSKDQFSNELSELKEYFQIPGLSVLVTKGEQIIFEDYLGFADIDLEIPMDSVTTIQMASLTKMFSAIAVMQLVEEGKITLDEPVNTYVNGRGLGDSIQIKHILSHTSQGIPGKHFYYNNNRFMMLGDIIEKASGKDFKTNIYERIITPLKLQNTYLLKDSMQVVLEKRKIAQPYFLGGQPIKGYMERKPQPGFIDYGFSAAAGVSSTVRDLSKLSTALDNNTLLNDSSKKTMFTSFDIGIPYGLGVFTQEFMNEQLVWGYGQYDCYSSLFLKVPNKDLTFIIAANNNLMSDPARLIAGDVTYSLFALSFLKNYVFEFDAIPLFENQITLPTLKDRLTEDNLEFYRKKLLAQSLAATFMYRYADEEGGLSKQILNLTFDQFLDYEEYGDLILMRNLFMLKSMGSFRGEEEFKDFDQQFEALGQKLLNIDKENPYANYYMANYFHMKQQQDSSLVHYKKIVEAQNFSPWWYTWEAQKWIDENYTDQ